MYTCAGEYLSVCSLSLEEAQLERLCRSIIMYLPSDFTMSDIKILDNILCTLSGLNYHKAYWLYGVPLIFLKNYIYVLTPSLVKLSTSIFPSFWKMPLYNLCLQRVTALSLLTSVLQLYFLVFITNFETILTSKFLSSV